MNEIIFIIEEAPEGGYTARALEADIFTEHNSIQGLKSMIKEAVDCHFEEEDKPKMLRLHYIKEENLPLTS
ncbi:MAG: hypothetical protein KGY69_14710 [Bacteroidales bacterium]|nr:hypothetical protein [Bacteroidales bacterium]